MSAPPTSLPDAADPPPGVVFETHGLGVRFGAVWVLRDVSLTVRAGEVVAVLGANGSGKSTLIRTLVGIQRASAGRLSAPDPARVGYVPQRGSSEGGIPATALEVVASGLVGRRQLWLPRRWRERALAALAEVGMEPRAGEAVIHLSGGQQQRVFIARALVRQPEVLVLDEPLAGVDAASQRQLAELLAGLVAQGMTVVVVLHELGDLAPLITRAIVLREGEVVADGPPAGLGPPEAHHSHLAGAPGPQLAAHETGFPTMSPQVSALTSHHRASHHLASHHRDHHAIVPGQAEAPATSPTGA